MAADWILANGRVLTLDARRTRATALAGAAGRIAAAGEPTGVLIEHNLIQVLEFTLMGEVPRFTHADRLRVATAASGSTARISSRSRRADGSLRSVCARARLTRLPAPG